MALTTGTRRALAEATVWLGVACCCGLSLVYFDAIKALVGAGLTGAAAELPQATGTEAPATKARPHQSVTLASDDRGHFVANAHVNGRTIDVLVDTGATSVALTWNDARSAGVHVGEADFRLPVNTANGVSYVAPVMLDTIVIGDIEVRNVQAVVARPGQLAVTLLGMSFLRRLSRFEMRGRELMLAQ